MAPYFPVFLSILRKFRLWDWWQEEQEAVSPGHADWDEALGRTVGGRGRVGMERHCCRA